MANTSDDSGWFVSGDPAGDKSFLGDIQSDDFLRLQVERYKNSLEEAYQIKIDINRQAVSELTDENKSLKKQLEEQKSAACEAQAERARLQQQLSDCQQQLQVAQKRSRRSHDSVADSERTCAQLQQTLDDARKRLVAVTNQRDQLLADLATAQLKTKEFDDLTQRCDALKSTEEQLNRRIHGKDHYIDFLQAKNGALMLQLQKHGIVEADDDEEGCGAAGGAEERARSETRVEARRSVGGTSRRSSSASGAPLALRRGSGDADSPLKAPDATRRAARIDTRPSPAASPSCATMPPRRGRVAVATMTDPVSVRSRTTSTATQSVPKSTASFTGGDSPSASFSTPRAASPSRVATPNLPSVAAAVLQFSSVQSSAPRSKMQAKQDHPVASLGNTKIEEKLADQDKQLADLTKEIAESRAMLRRMERDKEEAEKRCKFNTELRSKYQNEADQLRLELTESRGQLSKADQERRRLATQLEKMQDQVDVLLSVGEQLRDEKRRWAAERQEAERRGAAAEQRARDAAQQLSAERALRQQADVKVGELDAERTRGQLERAADTERHRQQVAQLEQRAAQLRNEVTKRDQLMQTAEQQLRQLQERLQRELDTQHDLKEERSELITDVQQLKEANGQLREQLRLQNGQFDEMRNRLGEVQNQMHDMQENTNVDQFRLKSQLTQQNKLIDYLRTVVMPKATERDRGSVLLKKGR